MTATAARAWTRGRLVVVLCSDLDDETTLDRHHLAGELRRRHGVEVVLGGAVCADADLPSTCADGDSRLVVGCRDGQGARARVAARGRTLGLSYDDVDTVALVASADATPSDVAAAALLALDAAIASVQAEPYPMDAASRVTAAGPAAMPVLAVDSCRAGTGCTWCVGHCPIGAIASTPAGPRIDPERCTGCGLCTGGCPTAAWRLSGYSPRQLAARLTSLLQPDDLPPAAGIVLTCAAAGGATPLGAGWADLVVPSLPSVRPGLPLQALTHGARRVHLRCDAHADCMAAASDVAEFCNRTLTASGQPPAVTAGNMSPVLVPVGPALPRATSSVTLVEPESTIEAVKALAPSEVVRVEHDSSPTGSLHVDGDHCTGCEVCVSVCPRSALGADRGEAWTLSYRASQCTACGICVERCPERAISATPVLDTQLLTVDRVTLVERLAEPCSGCGRPVREPAVRRAAAARLANASPALSAMLTSTCDACGPGAVGVDLPTRAVAAETSRQRSCDSTSLIQP